MVITTKLCIEYAHRFWNHPTRHSICMGITVNSWQRLKGPLASEAL
ncbi:MAG: hypothetical protein LBQ77_03515 [Treponema sp.]|nr:hypothetical protein [Treponema sp.]